MNKKVKMKYIFRYHSLSFSGFCIMHSFFFVVLKPLVTLAKIEQATPETTFTTSWTKES